MDRLRKDDVYHGCRADIVNNAVTRSTALPPKIPSSIGPFPRLTS
jgi:hypothetical protein